jgi:predicted flap endonuclease-1-like 5' DNA nuclease
MFGSLGEEQATVLDQDPGRQLARERDRLEQLLMLDANWRALKQLDEREAAGHPLQVVDGVRLRATLAGALAANRLYGAHSRVMEQIAGVSGAKAPGSTPLAGANGLADGTRVAAAVERLGASVRAARGQTLSSRIVLLPDSDEAAFKTRLKVKLMPVNGEAAVMPAPDQAVAATGPAADDDLGLIQGFDREAVALLRGGGVTRFSSIAGWTSAECAAWRQRLAGAASGPAIAWIEQAAILANGNLPHYARRHQRGEFAALVAAPAVEPPRAVMAEDRASDRAVSLVASANAPPQITPPRAYSFAVMAALAASPGHALALAHTVTPIEVAPAPSPALPAVAVSEAAVSEPRPAHDEAVGEAGLAARRVLEIDAGDEQPAERWRRAFDRRERGRIAWPVVAAPPSPTDVVPPLASIGLRVAEDAAAPVLPANSQEPLPVIDTDGAIETCTDGHATQRRQFVFAEDGLEDDESGFAEASIEISARDPTDVTEPSVAADAESTPRAHSPRLARDATIWETEAAWDAEFAGASIVASDSSDDPSGTAVPASQGAHGSLMRRLQKAREHDRFNRRDYAAYYDEIEEASVSIVRHDRADGSEMVAGPAMAQAAATPVNRFLKALTGKR